jgi:hypothetical protein
MRTLGEMIYIQLISQVQNYIRTQEETIKIQISEENRRQWAEQAASLARYYEQVWEESKP